jgi:hypothetical protein
MKCDIVPFPLQCRPGVDSRMSSPPKLLSDDELARSLEAARQFAGEDHDPLTPQEEAIVKEVRASKHRPTKKEIAALAKRIARSSN